jgi:ubiquinone/menaquinone biosynthesis C-methylase UbiE
VDTHFAQRFWAEHPVDPAWVAHYRESDQAPYRQWIVESLKLLEPWCSLFEIGCHCGPQLAAIQRAYPSADLFGCDVNWEAVDDARQRFPNVVRGAFPAITRDWPDQSVDVVVSCYTLAYLDPGDIEAALTEAGRMARRGIVLCEPMAWDLAQVESMCREGVFGEWRHAYLHYLMGLPGFAGWTAHCQEVECQPTRLSGLIVAVRP